jgi:predicted acylesterase/phospholipase RssA
MPKADLVLEGGGMKGLGLVGAVRRLMLDGYTSERVAGTSAGAVVAAFVAAGASADEVNELMGSLDYSRVPDRAPPGIPLVSEGISLLTHRGAYEGDYIRDFVHEELAKRGVTTFADLRRRARGDDPNLEPFQRYKLVVTATDITHGRLLRLPWDYGLIGLDPDEQLVADAVRASISIPLYFEPVELRNPATGEKTTLVDGGVLSNFPIEIFDRTDRKPPRWPTLGVRVIPDLPAGDANLFPLAALPALPPVHLLEQVVTTAIVGHDQTYLERPCVRRRTIQVDTAEVGVVDFDAPKSVRDQVVANGDAAAAAFLASWDFDAYRRDCRAAPEA